MCRICPLLPTSIVAALVPAGIVSLLASAAVSELLSLLPLWPARGVS